MNSEIAPTTVTLPALPTAEDVRELLTSALPYMTNPVSIERVTSFLVTGSVPRDTRRAGEQPSGEPRLDNAARDVTHWAQGAFTGHSVSSSMLPSSFCRLRELVALRAGGVELNARAQARSPFISTREL